MAALRAALSAAGCDCRRPRSGLRATKKSRPGGRGDGGSSSSSSDLEESAAPPRGAARAQAATRCARRRRVGAFWQARGRAPLRLGLTRDPIQHYRPADAGRATALRTTSSLSAPRSVRRAASCELIAISAGETLAVSTVAYQGLRRLVMALWLSVSAAAGPSSLSSPAINQQEGGRGGRAAERWRGRDRDRDQVIAAECCQCLSLKAANVSLAVATERKVRGRSHLR